MKYYVEEKKKEKKENRAFSSERRKKRSEEGKNGKKKPTTKSIAASIRYIARDMKSQDSYKEVSEVCVDLKARRRHRRFIIAA